MTNGYVNETIEAQPCPFCGSEDVTLHITESRYGCDSAYCNSCKTEVTFYKVLPQDRWDNRADNGRERCPFCGGKPEFDGPMTYSTLFVDAYCPTCRIRFEFQTAKRSKDEKRNIDKARKAFERRAGR